MEAHLKLINEISRLDRQIRSIEELTMKQLEDSVTEWEIEMNSK